MRSVYQRTVAWRSPQYNVSTQNEPPRFVVIPPTGGISILLHNVLPRVDETNSNHTEALQLLTCAIGDTSSVTKRLSGRVTGQRGCRKSGPWLVSSCGERCYLLLWQTVASSAAVCPMYYSIRRSMMDVLKQNTNLPLSWVCVELKN